MSIRLFILGTLAKGNNYPYMIKKKLLDALPINNLTGMSEGKFYYNFEALQKKGLIESVEIIHEKNRPDKTLYTITKSGRQALELDIYDSFKSLTNIQDLYISIYLLDFVDPAKAAFLFEDTIQKEKQRWQEYSALREQENDKLCDEKVQFISDHAFSNSAFNIQWMEKLLKLIQTY
ncbi:PadR family transcriptional regulator [Bacillus testis]|uniref:PadR family transcriptional regulator n=1 Tax=Bacillus testis TaxID=1622072 RepID=UPI00067E7374|nr:PadR family transcriptional regulator [Bacillus testis]